MGGSAAGLEGWIPHLDTKFLCHYLRAMKNVTITLDEDVARWTQVHAAKQSISVSRWVGEMLRERMLLEESYRASMSQFFSIKPRRLRADPATRYPSRAELYDRPGLR